MLRPVIQTSFVALDTGTVLDGIGATPDGPAGVGSGGQAVRSA
jgi:hypothetical protein